MGICGAQARLIERCLRTPLQPGEIWVFAILSRAIPLLRLALDTARFFFALLLLAGFFSVSLRGCSFAWSSDDALLSKVMGLSRVYDEAGPRLRVAVDFLDAG